MHIRQRLRRVGLALVAGTVALLGPGAAPAAADSGAALPVGSHSDIVVDGVHRQVFVSDPVSGSVVVTDYDGALLRQITAVPGAAGLALSGDSGTLYVALRTGDAISAIDTETLAETARWETGAGTAPSQTAVAGGKLWFSYGSSGEGNIGSVDLSGDEPRVTLDQDGPYHWYSAPLLASAPGDPDVLVAGAPGQSPVEVAVYDVSSGTAQGQAYRWNPGADGSGNLRDMALTADGTTVVLASGYPYHHHAYRTSDLAADGTYATDSYPNAVAVAPDGAVAAGIDGAYAPDVHLFDRGTSTAIRSYDFQQPSGAAGLLRPAGLAWAPDASRVFAVTESPDSANLTLRVLNDPARTETTMTVEGPQSSPRNRELTLTGRLASTAPFAEGSSVRVSRIGGPEDGEGTALGTAAVAPDGGFTFQDRPGTEGEIRYVFHYAGDARHTDATGAVTVTVGSGR
ncbi:MULTISPECIES: YncE family protein [unclassified Streptomyces]|uniref:YncE family protein n=1 Tax=unclassified Streptomyces TaxID=2593676 RepID=UPI00211D234E|nr:hypothetical protein [Streptomyces sp. Ru87]